MWWPSRGRFPAAGRLPARGRTAGDQQYHAGQCEQHDDVAQDVNWRLLSVGAQRLHRPRDLQDGEGHEDDPRESQGASTRARTKHRGAEQHHEGDEHAPDRVLRTVCYSQRDREEPKDRRQKQSGQTTPSATGEAQQS
ncbi:MAG: hypothetical protein LC808_25230 [Actinobacteria bacterium]|nr:hypothetical protein [Actinomycetota bacterium]